MAMFVANMAIFFETVSSNSTASEVQKLIVLLDETKLSVVVSKH